jgi:hypothetical protein
VKALLWAGAILGALGALYSLVTLLRGLVTGSIKISWYGDEYDRTYEPILYWVGIAGRIFAFSVSLTVHVIAWMRLIGR